MLQCSGRRPCENCIRRQKLCQLPARNSIILFDNERQVHAVEGKGAPRNCGLNQYPSLEKQILYVSAFLRNFLPRNNFTGRSSSYCLATQGTLVSQKSLLNVACAIGAIQSSRQTLEGHHKLDGFHFYYAAVASLRTEIAEDKGQSWLNLLMSTFFLGLFELICNNTGESWLSHMLYGTSKILQLLGPENLRTGLAKAIFLEIRAFEIVRTVLFNESSFLSQKPWVDLSEDMETNESVHAWNPKERLLNIMTLVSDLCARTKQFLLAKQNCQPRDSDHRRLTSFAEQGLQLRSDLFTWRSMAQQWQAADIRDNQMIIARAFYSAIAIYLSGVYDYSSLWTEHKIVTPVLSPAEIQQHVATILTVTSVALRDTNISGLLFLFPLRIAGARAITAEQRMQIQILLTDISSHFMVANAFITDLLILWANSASKRQAVVHI